MGSVGNVTNQPMVSNQWDVSDILVILWMIPLPIWVVEEVNMDIKKVVHLAFW